MKLLAIGRPRHEADAAAQIGRHAAAEMRELWELYRDGAVREMYSPGGPGAVLVLEAGDRAGAEAVLGRLPLVQAGVVEFEVIELHPFAALAILFRETEDQ